MPNISFFVLLDTVAFNIYNKKIPVSPILNYYFKPNSYFMSEKIYHFT